MIARPWVWLCVLGCATAVADASDRVRYTPERVRRSEPPQAASAEWIPQPLLTVVGTIQSFDQEQLEILSEGAEEPLRIPSDRLLPVDPGWEDADAVAGLDAYRRSDYKQAIPHLLEAVKRRPSAWRQQWLSVRMANAAYEAGRYPAVLQLIAQLDRTGLPAVMVGQLPIQWHRTARDPRLVAAAHSQLAAAEPLVRLTAASMLLGGAQSAAAEATLRRLSQDAAHPLVARLADVLLWRQAPPPETKKEFPRWRQKMEQLPIALRWGPMMVVADRLQAAGEQEQALEWWLAASLLAPQADHPDVARARRRAAELLEQLGLPADPMEPAAAE